MTAWLLPESCPDVETLAALAEGRLSEPIKAELEAHLADCEECLALVAEAKLAMVDAPAATAAAPASSPPRVATIRSSATWRVAAAVTGLAAALLLAVRLMPFEPAEPDPMKELSAAVGSERRTEARLSGDFAYGPLRIPRRGGPPEGNSESFKLLAAASLAQERAQKSDASADRQALGVAYVLLGRDDEAVRTLEQVAGRGDATAAQLNDLAAAYVTRALHADRPDDWPRALEAAQRALEHAPGLAAALYNKALALERLGLEEAAKDAWRAYLNAEPSTDWQRPAREHLQALESASKQGRIAPHGPESSLDALCSPGGVVLEIDPAGDNDARRLTTELTQALRRPDATERCLCQLRDAMRDGRTSLITAAAPKCTEAQRAGTAARELALTYQSIGLYYAGKLDDADATVQPLLGNSSATSFLRARARYVSSVLAFARGDYQRAMADGADALAAVPSYDNQTAPSIHQNMASAARAMGDTREAWRHFAAALAGLPAMESPVQRHALLNVVGLAATGGGLARAALAVYAEAERLATGPSAHAFVTEARINSARAYLTVGDVTGARQALAGARSHLDAVSDPAIRMRQQAEWLGADAELALQSHRADADAVSGAAIDSYSRLGLTFRQATLRLLRARALRAAGAEADAEAEYERGIALIDSQQSRIEERRLRVSHLDRVWDLYEDLASLRVSRNDYPGALDVLLAARRRIAAPHGSGTTLRANLEHEELALTYAVVGKRIVRWRTTSDGGTSGATLTADADDVLRELATLQDALSGRRLSETRRLLGVLGVDLLTGVDLTGIPRVRLTLDGPIDGVPFHALVLPGSGRHVVDVTEVVRADAPWASALSQTDRIERAVFMADPAPSPAFLPALPGARAEARAAAAMYRQSQILLGADVDGQALTHALGTRGVVHFAGHALVDPENSWRSRLVVSASSPDGGYWYPDRQPDDSVRAVVVLAACRAASGETFRGAGTVSLASLFIAKGAPAVIAATADLDDEEARVVFTELHRHLAAGDDAVAALNRTQRMISSSSPDALFSWIPLIVVEP